MASRLAGAGAASPTGRPPRRSWAVLDRIPHSLDPDDLPAGMGYVVSNSAPPNLSTLFLSRALLDDADDVRVECAEGNILVSVWSSPQERRHFLVCRSGSGVVDLVREPEAQEAVGVLETPAHSFSCTGIAPSGGGGGDGYVLARLERGSSSSTSASRPASSLPFRLACFSSSSSSWEIKQVATRCFDARSSEDEAGWASVNEIKPEEDHPSLQVRTVLCHPDGRRLVFVDLENGVLVLIDPRDAAPAGIWVVFPIEHDGGLPDLEDEEDPHDPRDAGARRCVCCSEGAICFIEWRCRAFESVISSWRLREAEEEYEWMPIFRAIHVDEFTLSQPSLDDGQQFTVLGLGPLDPTNRHKLTFCCSECAFTAVVDTTETMPFRRVHFGEQAAPADAGHNWAGSWLDVAIWTFQCGNDPAAVGPGGGGAGGGRAGKWSSLRSKAKCLGVKTLQIVNTCRKHIDKAPPVAQVLGGGASFMGLPLAGTVVPVVDGVLNFEKAATVGEQLFGWWGERRRACTEQDRVVGSTEEAERVIEQWVDMGKPKKMAVYPAPGLSRQQQLAIRDTFCQHGADELVPAPPPPSDEDEFHMVSEGDRYFAV